MKAKLTRTYTGKDVLCNYCKTKKFRTTGNKEKYGSIIKEIKEVQKQQKSVQEYVAQFK